MLLPGSSSQLLSTTLLDVSSSIGTSTGVLATAVTPSTEVTEALATGDFLGELVSVTRFGEVAANIQHYIIIIIIIIII